MEQSQPTSTLNDNSNAQVSEQQKASVGSNPKRVKAVYIVLVILILVILGGGIVGGIYLLKRKTGDRGSGNQETEEEIEEEEEEMEDEGWETVEVYFANPSGYEDFTTLVAVERETDETDLHKYALDQLILGPTDDEKLNGYIAAFELIGFSECGDEDYNLELSGSELTISFCRDIAASFNEVEGAWAGITLSAEGRAYEAISETLKFDSIEKVVVKDKYGACFAVSAGVNEDCVE